MRGEKKAQTANTVSWSQTKHSGFKERYLKSHLILYSWKYWLWLCVVRSTETSNSAENVIWKVKSDQILDHYLSTPYQSLLLRFYHKLQIEWIFKNILIFLLQTTLKARSLRVSGSGSELFFPWPPPSPFLLNHQPCYALLFLLSLKPVYVSYQNRNTVVSSFEKEVNTGSFLIRQGSVQQ